MVFSGVANYRKQLTKGTGSSKSARYTVYLPDSQQKRSLFKDRNYPLKGKDRSFVIATQRGRNPNDREGIDPVLS